MPEAQWDCEVVRISYQFATIRVEAKSPELARAKAMAEAGNHYYKEKNVEYEPGDAPVLVTP